MNIDLLSKDEMSNKISNLEVICSAQNETIYRQCGMINELQISEECYLSEIRQLQKDKDVLRMKVERQANDIKNIRKRLDDVLDELDKLKLETHSVEAA